MIKEKLVFTFANIQKIKILYIINVSIGLKELVLLQNILIACFCKDKTTKDFFLLTVKNKVTIYFKVLSH